MKKFRIYRRNDYIISEINTFQEEKTSKLSLIWLILAGIGIGWVNGFWGGGGGMICVPVLSNLLHLPEKSAHATTLLIMLPLSICSFVVYLLRGSIDVMMAVEVGVGFILGGLAGALLLKNMNNIVLRFVFAIVIIAGGIKILL